MRKMSNRTKDKITITAVLVGVVVVLLVVVSAISKAFAENIVEFYDTDSYTYTTIEHKNYCETKVYDKQAKKYLDSSYTGKNFGEK